MRLEPKWLVWLVSQLRVQKWESKIYEGGWRGLGVWKGLEGLGEGEEGGGEGGRGGWRGGGGGGVGGRLEGGWRWVGGELEERVES